jgi:hypothetical protein
MSAAEARLAAEGGTPARELLAAAAPAPSPLAAAFRALAEGERRAVQARLAEAGFYTAAVDGFWGPRTEAALGAFLAEAAGRGLPLEGATPEGARAALDFVRSAAFREGWPAPPPPAAAPGGAFEPSGAFEW